MITPFLVLSVNYYDKKFYTSHSSHIKFTELLPVETFSKLYKFSPSKTLENLMSQVVSRPLPLRKLEATYDLLLEGDSTIIYGSQVFPLFQIHTQIILAPSVQPQLYRFQIYRLSNTH